MVFLHCSSVNLTKVVIKGESSQTRLENRFLEFGGFPNVLHGLAEFHQERIENMRLPQMQLHPVIAVEQMPLMNEPALPHQHHMHHHLHHHHHLHQLTPQNQRLPPHQVQNGVAHNPHLPPGTQPQCCAVNNPDAQLQCPFYNPNLPHNPRPQRPAAHNPYLHPNPRPQRPAIRNPYLHPNHPINNNLQHYHHHPYDLVRRYKANAVKAKKVPRMFGSLHLKVLLQVPFSTVNFNGSSLLRTKHLPITGFLEHLRSDLENIIDLLSMDRWLKSGSLKKTIKTSATVPPVAMEASTANSVEEDGAVSNARIAGQDEGFLDESVTAEEFHDKIKENCWVVNPYSAVSEKPACLTSHHQNIRALAIGITLLTLDSIHITTICRTISLTLFLLDLTCDPTIKCVILLQPDPNCSTNICQTSPVVATGPNLQLNCCQADVSSGASCNVSIAEPGSWEMHLFLHVWSFREGGGFGADSWPISAFGLASVFDLIWKESVRRGHWPINMGNRSSLLLREEEINQIQEETGCMYKTLFSAVTPNQIERLYSRFTSLDRGDCGTLSREDFLRIPELAINPLGDRIVHAFFEEGASDRVNFRQFMQVLAHFRPIKKGRDNRLNSREQKLKFAFKMYDLDNDEKISRDELLAILHMMVGANISEEQLTSIAERTILEADHNGDQMISFEEFCTALERTDVEQKMSIRFLN
nr:unnamed protein product [Timema californicum]